MVDHWISNQRVQSGTSSPVHETESISPSPARKNLKIQTTVSEDKPRKIGSQKTLSQRYVTFHFIIQAVFNMNLREFTCVYIVQAFSRHWKEKMKSRKLTLW